MESHVQNQRSFILPGFLMSNVMSLAPKIDEIRHTVTKEEVESACFNESWLKDSIHDNSLTLLILI